MESNGRQWTTYTGHASGSRGGGSGSVHVTIEHCALALVNSGRRGVPTARAV